MMTSEEVMTFGDWLKSRRKGLDLTQDQLGKLAGCSSAAIRKIEAGERKPSRELAELLAHALQIPDVEMGVFLDYARGLLPVTLPLIVPLERRANLPGSPLGNLEVPLTSLVQRAKVLDAVTDQLSLPEARWITLIGPPGIGKTRLSIEIGCRVQTRYPEGIWFVDLAPLEQADHVLPAINRALAPFGLPASANLDTLSSLLKNCTLLLILDNFEHIPDAAIEIASLLKRCRSVKVLATSRIPLYISGEHRYQVPPLSTPPAGMVKDFSDLLVYESVQLFVMRVRQHQPGFQITEEISQVVADICATLEGNPLAIELAAASSQKMTLVELDSALHNMEGVSWIKLLSTPARDLPDRQRTLENVLAWSYTLLSNPQQELFCKLSVFSGWFDLDAVSEICFGGDASPRHSPRELLEGLSDHSLLVRESMDGVSYWSMLEIIHEYAKLMLEPDQRPGLELRFSRYFQKRVEALGNDLDAESRESFLRRNTGNLTAALRWAIVNQQSGMGFILAENLDSFWSSHGYSKEGLDMVEQLFTLPDTSAPEIRANRLQMASDLAWQQHDFETALKFAKAAAELGQEHDLREQYPGYLNRMGRIYIEQGRYSDARQALEECVAIVRTEPTTMNIGIPLAQLGELALFEGHLEEAKSALTEALGRLTADDDIFLAMVTVDLAEVALVERDFDQARAWLKRASGYAGSLLRRTLVFLCTATGYLVLNPVHHEREFLSAARMYGAIWSLTERSGVILGSFYLNLNQQRNLILRRRLTANVWKREMEHGRQWSSQEALAEATHMLTG